MRKFRDFRSSLQIKMFCKWKLAEKTPMGKFNEPHTERLLQEAADHTSVATLSVRAVLPELVENRHGPRASEKDKKMMQIKLGSKVDSQDDYSVPMSSLGN